MAVGSRLGFVYKEHATRRTLRVYEPKLGHMIVDTINADGESEVVEFDFSTLPEGRAWRRWNSTTEPSRIPLDWGLPELAVEIVHVGEDPNSPNPPKFLIGINWYHAAGERPALTRYTNHEFPHYRVWDDSPQTPLVPTVSYDESSLPYSTKQEVAALELENWRKQKRVWLAELEQRSDLNPELVKHGGYWLRAADAALQIEFQDPDVDPAVVAQMARLAMKGAADIDSVDKFAENLNQYSTLFPTGPDRPMLWVTKGSGNGSLSECEQLDLADSHQYPAGTLPSDYNPIATDWIVANQVGVATVDDDAPSPGDTVTVTLTDPDGIVGTPTYQWQRNVSDIWTDISSETAAAYAIDAAETSGAQFRCLISYTDNYGPNQSAISPVVTVA